MFVTDIWRAPESVSQPVMADGAFDPFPVRHHGVHPLIECDVIVVVKRHRHGASVRNGSTMVRSEADLRNVSGTV